MKKIDKAIKIIVKELKDIIFEDYEDYDIRNWNEMLRAFGSDSNDMKEEIKYFINNYEIQNNETIFLTDDLEIEDEDSNKIYSYKDLIKLVRKELFN